jgi:hypothetical protein
MHQGSAFGRRILPKKQWPMRYFSPIYILSSIPFRHVRYSLTSSMAFLTTSGVELTSMPKRNGSSWREAPARKKKSNAEPTCIHAEDRI